MLGLVGSIIGAAVGGLFVESPGFAAWIKALNTFMIYTLNWALIPQDSAKKGGKNVVLLLIVYKLTLFLGTVSFCGSLPLSESSLWKLLFSSIPPTFSGNFAIDAVLCPLLQPIASLKLKAFCLSVGNYWE